MLLTPGNQPDGSGTHTPGLTSQGGVLLTLNAAAQTIATGADSKTALVWSGTAAWDPGTIWTSGASSTFTVPSGWTHCRVIAGVRWVANSNGARRALCTVNGAVNPLYGGCIQEADTSGSGNRTSLASGIIPVAQNDTIQIVVDQDSGGNLDVQQTVTTFVAILKWNTEDYSHVSLSTAQTIVNDTETLVAFDTLEKDALNIADVLEGYSRFNIGGLGGTPHRVYAGFKSETNGGMWQARFAADDDSPATDYHQSYAAVGAEEGATNASSLGWEFLNSGPVKIPSVVSTGDILALEVKHNHGSDLDIQDAYMQIEKIPEDTLGCVFYHNADQTGVTNGVGVDIQYDELYERAPGGFTGGSTGSITVPAVPGGGSWDYGIITITCRGKVSATGLRGITPMIDTGGGFATYTGGTMRIQEAASANENVLHSVAIAIAPAAGDEFNVEWFQNSGSNDTLPNAREQAFTLELFKT